MVNPARQNNLGLTSPVSPSSNLLVGLGTNGIPSAVKTARGLSSASGTAFSNEAIAFDMANDAGRTRLVYDPAQSKLFKAQGSKFVAASPEEQKAITARLTQRDLAATRPGSRYDRLVSELKSTKIKSNASSDRFERTKPGATPTIDVGLIATVEVRAKPEPVKAPKTELSTSITTRPLESVPPPATVPPPPTVAPPPPAASKQEPSEPAKLSREAFMAELSSRRLATRTPIKGVDLGAADLDTNGVIAGEREWGTAFGLVDRLDRNGDAKSLNPSAKPVAAALDQLRQAPGDATPRKPVYSSAELRNISYALDSGEPNIGSARLSEGSKIDYNGRRLSGRTFEMNMNAGAGSSATVVYDATRRAFYKRGERDALVPMTDADLRSLRQNLKAKEWHPNQLGPDQRSDFYNHIYLGLFPSEANRVELESPT